MRELTPIRRLAVVVAALALAVPLALPALAAPNAEDGHGGSEGGLFSGDLGNVIWTLVIFLLVLFVLGKFAWGPILSGLQDREKFIRDALDEAKKERDEAKKSLEAYEAKLASAREEVDEIMDEARRDAAAVRQREDERAREEAEQTIERAKREIEIATDTAVKDLYARATRLATGAASAVLEREIRPEDHERLVADSIAAIDRMDAGRTEPGGPDA